MNRDFENDFGQDDDNIGSRRRSRDNGSDFGADSNTPISRRSRSGPDIGGGDRTAGQTGRPAAGTPRQRPEQAGTDRSRTYGAPAGRSGGEQAGGFVGALAGRSGGRPAGGSAGAPAGRSGGIPSGSSAGAPAGRSGRRPAGSLAGAPAGRSGGMPSGGSAGAPAGRSGGMPSGGSAGAPAGRSGGRPAGSSAGAPAGRSGGIPSGSSAGAPAGRSGGMPSGGSAGASAGRSGGSAGASAGRSGRMPSGGSAGAPTERSGGIPSGGSAGAPAGRSGGMPSGGSAGASAGHSGGRPSGSFSGSPVSGGRGQTGAASGRNGADRAGSLGAGRDRRTYSPEVSALEARTSGTRGASPRKGSQDASGRRAERETAAADRAGGEPKKHFRALIITLVLLEFLVILPGIFATRQFLKKYNMLQRDPNFNIEKETNPNLNVEKVANMKGYWTVALFGVDSRNNSVGKGNNADVIIIANVNQENGEIKLVSIFRDSYLNLDDQGSYNKINQAYFRGGPEMAIKALNKNLDIQIDDYATFNWKAVADAINILGGVDVDLTKAEFYYINAYITETVEATGVGSHQLKSAGPNHLDGIQAVAYARLRKMDTDFARTERQRDIIEKCFDKLKAANFSVINNVMEVVFKQILTSVTLDDIIPAAKNLTKYTIADTIGFPMQRSDANMGKKGDCVIPQTLESNVIALHKFLFNEDDYQPSDMVKKISAKISSDSGLYKEGKYIDHVGTDGGYIPKPTQGTTKAAEETTKSGESEESSSSIDEGIIDGENPWDLETDEDGSLVDPPEGGYPGYYPGGYPGSYPGATQPSVNYPGASTAPSSPYPGNTTPPSEGGNQGSPYPGSPTLPGGGMTGPGGGTSGNPGNTRPTAPGNTRPTAPGNPGSTSPVAPGNPDSTNPTKPSYPGGTGGGTSPHPGGTTEGYVPDGPGSVIIGPGN